MTLNLGPNDAGYVRGFREDWEWLGRTRFHWTGLSSSITLPVRLRGEGHLLRMRARRHFVEPAWVRLSVEGRTLGAPFTIEADTRVPYRLLELPLPALEGRGPFQLVIEARSQNPRPLGMALDWVEVERRGPGARVLPLPSLMLALSAVVLAAFVAARLAGAARWLAATHALLLVVAAGLGVHHDVVAAARILSEGAGAYVAVSALGLLAVRSTLGRRVLGLEPASRAGAVLLLLVLVALAIRLVLLLHPQFFYPDVRVHANMAAQLQRHGLVRFLREFTENQYRFSVGLQLENGHWYAFPYPPAFYILSWPLTRLLRYRPEVAVSLLGAVVNSLEALLVYAIGRRLRLGPVLAMAGAMAHPVLPIVLARLTLAYFPALVGHAVDAAVILYLLARAGELDRPRVVAALAVLLAIALLTYTQAVLNFAILLPLVLALQVAFDRTPGARRRQLGLAVAGVAGVLLSLAVFYGRYVPVFLDMRRGVPMAEERVLLEKPQARAAEVEEEPAPPEPPDDPYAGPGVDPVRGLRKAASRLFIFYSYFSVAVVAGLGLMLALHVSGFPARLVAAWALTYVLLNLASGGLPGPNLVRYNKDLEIVAPLFCLALGAVGGWLWERGRAWAQALAVAYGLSYWLFGAMRAVRYLTEKFVLER